MDVATARAAAYAFVLGEAGFAQVTTIDQDGFPVSRTMTAFLEPDWSVSLVQRAGHRRLDQWRRDPHTLVCWVGAPAPGATNERPHVFDIGRLPPRAVAVRGTAAVMPPDWTLAVYRREVARQRAAGCTRAPVRTDDEVAAELAGVRIEPARVRLEGFGVGAESHLWTVRRGSA
ncbi:hypothetical protein [Micromonospora sp. WMMD975]|uniref:hypothetical protein n=1 Tax=Micromonospora sp. WMMD975 TaxID=3016087 RepID=UPI00249B9CDE|nr:hypothetical protein [Micromonospora sp. WMMD975]WFE36336.1 hypothetical protein O7613_13385 [Micromonospora sp. WMMD975]